MNYYSQDTRVKIPNMCPRQLNIPKSLSMWNFTNSVDFMTDEIVECHKPIDKMLKHRRDAIDV